jgi:NhaP-type Na+/H+ or K+/H+ antiporter
MARASTDEAIELVGVVLLALAMQAALVVGALVRAGAERVRKRPEAARVAARVAGATALVGIAFVGTLVAMARGSSGVFALMALGAVGVVVARMWRARVGGVPRTRTPASRRPVRPRTPARPRARTRRAELRAARTRRF